VEGLVTLDLPFLDRIPRIGEVFSGHSWLIYFSAVAVAALLGRANPIGVAMACLVFGLTDSIGFRLQGREIPSQFTAVLPYVATLIGLAVVETRRANRRTRQR